MHSRLTHFAIALAIFIATPAFGFDLYNNSDTTIFVTKAGIVEGAPSTHASRPYYSAGGGWYKIAPGGKENISVNSEGHLVAVIALGGKTFQVKAPHGNDGMYVGVHFDSNKSCSVRANARYRDVDTRIAAFARAGCPDKVKAYKGSEYKSPLFDNLYEVNQTVVNRAKQVARSVMPFSGTQIIFQNNTPTTMDFRVRFISQNSSQQMFNDFKRVQVGAQSKWVAGSQHGEIQVQNGNAMVGVEGAGFGGGTTGSWGLDANMKVTGISRFERDEVFENGKRFRRIYFGIR